jgi:hypothetical protein
MSLGRAILSFAQLKLDTLCSAQVLPAFRDSYVKTTSTKKGASTALAIKHDQLSNDPAYLQLSQDIERLEQVTCYYMEVFPNDKLLVF